MTPAAVSQAVARLERSLGVRLLHRTTRHVSLSDEGLLFLTHCEGALDELRRARELVEASARAPRGEITVSLSPALARVVVATLPDLAARHPALEVRLQFTDRNARLAEDGVDVALRIGALGDSSLVGRKLMDLRWCTVAAPGYLARRGCPAHPSDLARHECLCFRSARGVRVPWLFAVGPDAQPAPVPVGGRFDFDQGEPIIDAAAAGLGIARAYDHMVRDRLHRGELVEVLQEYAVPGPPVHALYLPSQRSNPRVRAFVAFLAEALGGRPRAPDGQGLIAGAPGGLTGSPPDRRPRWFRAARRARPRPPG